MFAILQSLVGALVGALVAPAIRENLRKRGFEPARASPREAWIWIEPLPLRGQQSFIRLARIHPGRWELKIRYDPWLDPEPFVEVVEISAGDLLRATEAARTRPHLVDLVLDAARERRWCKYSYDDFI